MKIRLSNAESIVELQFISLCNSREVSVNCGSPLGWCMSVGVDTYPMRLINVLKLYLCASK